MLKMSSSNDTKDKKGNIDKFSERLKKARINAGFSSQEALAKVVYVDRVTMNYYENGSRKPDLDTFVRIVDALNVSCDYLLGYSKSPTREYHDTKEITGLSDKAIETLHTYALETKKNLDVKKYPITLEDIINQSRKKTYYMISYLLENDLKYGLFSKLEEFLCFKIKHKKVIDLEQDIINDDLGYTMTVQQWENITKIIVDETLFNIKKDIEKEAKIATKDNKKKK